MNKNHQVQGYTLLELMITIAIIAIIAAVAIPSYMDYTKKSHYSELIRATAPFKLGVVQCFTSTGSFTGCSSGNTPVNGIPPSITAPPNPNSAIRQITVTNGVITALPNKVNGLQGDEGYILTPKDNNGVISWMVSGKGPDSGLVR